jgi:hypothetical protein
MVLYLWSYTTIRQIFVTAVAFFAYNVFYLRKRYIGYVLMMIFGSLFHASALIYIPLVILLHFIKINRYIAFTLLILILISSTYVDGIIEYLFNAIISKTVYIEYVGTKWVNNAEVSSGLGIIFKYIMFSIMLLPIIKYNNKKETSNGLGLFLVFIFFEVVSIKVKILGRIARGLLFTYFLIVKSTVNGTSKYRSMILLADYICLFVLFLLDLKAGGHNSVPYRSIFQRF